MEQWAVMGLAAYAGLCLRALSASGATFAATPTPTPFALQVNLKPFQPPGWSDKIVVSTQAGTHSDSPSLASGDTLYLDWAMVNEGPTILPGTSMTTVVLVVDGQFRKKWVRSSDLEAGGVVTVEDYVLGNLDGGTHTLTIVIDDANSVSETNEQDNEHTKTIAVAGPTFSPTPTRTPEAPPNLAPIKPPGWSDTIVVSTQPGTHTDSPSLQGTDILYVDWAITNSGSGPVPFLELPSAQLKLYVDGRAIKVWSFPGYSWAPGLSWWIDDYVIGRLGGGTHTITIQADPNGLVSETDETDNDYAKTIHLSGPTFSPTLTRTPAATPTSTPRPELPNLAPFRPPGWSDSIVVSTQTGTHTDSASFNAGDPLYVDCAIQNGGMAAAPRPGNALRLAFDGVPRNYWLPPSELAPGQVWSVDDYYVGTLTAGTHTLTLRADPDNLLQETNESDNEYVKTITVSGAPTRTPTVALPTRTPTLVGAPNLLPYQPAAWSDKIVVSIETGTSTDSTRLAETDTLYIDWAVINRGDVATAARFYIEIAVDGAPVAQWYDDPPLEPGYYASIDDYELGMLAPGTHTVTITIDSTDAIAESGESDNTFTKTITVDPARPNLVPYQPAEWSDRIVVSTQRGTHADSALVAATDTLYVDWAVANDGTAATDARFTTELYVDDHLVDSWNADPPLSNGYFVYIEDAAIGLLPLGRHTLRIKTDSAGTIAERYENDNEYRKTIRVGPVAQCPGDCNSDQRVTVDELVRGVSIALGGAPLGNCAAFDVADDGRVTVDDLLAAVNVALHGCDMAASSRR